MLTSFKPKLCSHSNRCASYSSGKHPNTFSGKLQLPIAIAYSILPTYRIPEALLVDVLAIATAEVIEKGDILDEM